MAASPVRVRCGVADWWSEVAEQVVGVKQVIGDLRVVLQAAADGDYGMFGEALMWANLIAWEAHHKTIAEKRAQVERELVHEARQAEAAIAIKKAARKAKQDAKDAGLKAMAEGMLARIPAKGTTVTIDGFTGKVFWIGVTKFRGKWSARAGVKNSKNEVAWISADKF